MKLVKRKVTKKNVPPDLSAIRILLEGSGGAETMSDEELEAERARLLALLSERKGGEK